MTTKNDRRRRKNAVKRWARKDRMRTDRLQNGLSVDEVNRRVRRCASKHGERPRDVMGALYARAVVNGMI